MARKTIRKSRPYQPEPLYDYKNCAYCEQPVDSPYAMRHGGRFYFGHKRCMGAPMLRKLAGEPQQMTLDLEG